MFKCQCVIDHCWPSYISRRLYLMSNTNVDRLPAAGGNASTNNDTERTPHESLSRNENAGDSQPRFGAFSALLGSIKYLSLLLAVLQNTSLVLLLRWSRTQPGPRFASNPSAFPSEILNYCYCNNVPC